jgi:YD repeat-containing protein
MSAAVKGIAKEDTEPPRFISIYPAENTILPANPSFSIFAADDTAVSEISVYIRPSGSSEWESLETQEVNSQEKAVLFNWDTSAYPSGEYEVRVSIKDYTEKTGPNVIIKYTLNKNGPDRPVITITPENWQLNLTWAPSGGDNLKEYKVYRKSGNEDFALLKVTTEETLTDSPLSPEHSYTYIVEAHDKIGNVSTSSPASAQPLDIDTFAPIANAGADTIGVVGDAIPFDGSLSSDNDMISGYAWDFGDGATGEGAQVQHSYQEAGKYEVSLEVTDPAGNKSSDKITIDIYPDNQIGTLEIIVRDKASNKVLPYAYVYVDFPQEDVKLFRADANGKAVIVAPPGNYNISAYQTGYIPMEENVELEQYVIKQHELKLSKNELVINELISKELTIEEMVERGIDISDPDNQHVFDFTIKLEFEETPLPIIHDIIYLLPDGSSGGYTVKGSANGDKFNYGGSGVGVIEYEPLPSPEPLPPTVKVLTISNSVSWLKEFFDVGLLVMNTAPPQFVIENTELTLNLPYGLSFVPTENTSAQNVKLGNLEGQEADMAIWTVRGDQEGQYGVSVNFNGVLMPFGAPINSIMESSEPITVKGASGLHIYAYVEDKAYIGEKYYVHFVLKNESGRTFYNVNTTFGPFQSPDSKQETIIIFPDGTRKTVTTTGGKVIDLPSTDTTIPVITDGTSLMVRSLGPGQQISGTYTTTFTADNGASPDEVYYALRKAFVDSISGTEIPVTIEEIGSHMSKVIIEKSIVNFRGDPVDINTGAHVIGTEALGVLGIRPLTFDLSYDSKQLNDANSLSSNVLPNYLSELGKTELGAGWSHNYNTFVKDNGDGTVTVYWSPYNYTVFYSGNPNQQEIYAELNEDGHIVPYKKPKGAEKFYAASSAESKINFERLATGSYILEFVNGNQYLFDAEGKLSGMKDKTGNSISITRDGATLTIEEAASGKRLTAFYDNGRIASVKDNTGRETSFEYSGGYLTKITLPNGEPTSYSYDSEGNVLTGEDSVGVFFTNTYDDAGRVLTQDDGLDDGNLTRFFYDETSIPGTLITIVTDRAGNDKIYWNNRYGQLVKVRDEIGRMSTYTYDADGNQTSATNPNGYTTIYHYDENGNLAKVTDVEGIETNMVYDAENNRIKVENAEGKTLNNRYNDNNLLLSTTNEQGENISYSYNENGQVNSITKEGVGTSSFSYEDGMPVHSIDYQGYTESMSYNGAGFITESTARDGASIKLEYDEIGNIISKTDALGYKEEYTYDARGNKLSIKDNKGNVSSYVLITTTALFMPMMQKVTLLIMNTARKAGLLKYLMPLGMKRQPNTMQLAS